MTLSPEAREYAHNRYLAAEDRSCVLYGCGRREGAAGYVGEVEGLVGFEETVVGYEGFAFVIAHVCPFAEVGFGSLSGSIDRSFQDMGMISCVCDLYSYASLSDFHSAVQISQGVFTILSVGRYASHSPQNRPDVVGEFCCLYQYSAPVGGDKEVLEGD